MPHPEPVEPTAVVTRDGTIVPRSARRAVPGRPAPHALAVRLARAMTVAPVLGASALVVAAAAAVRAAETAGRRAARAGGLWPGDVLRGSGTPLPGPSVRVTWTQVEIRWPGNG